MALEQEYDYGDQWETKEHEKKYKHQCLQMVVSGVIAVHRRAELQYCPLNRVGANGYTVEGSEKSRAKAVEAEKIQQGKCAPDAGDRCFLNCLESIEVNTSCDAGDYDQLGEVKKRH